jgi:hypothetical protein
MDIEQQLPTDYATTHDVFATKNEEIALLKEALKKLTIERDLLLKLQKR